MISFKSLFSSNFWLSFLVILLIIKPPLFILLNFTDSRFQNCYYFVYIIALFFSLCTFFNSQKGLRSGLLTTLCITFLVFIGCWFSNAKSYIHESFGPLLLFMLIPLNLIQGFKKPIYFNRLLYCAIFLHYVIGVAISYSFMLLGFGYGADGMLTSYAISIPSACFLFLGIVEIKKRRKVLLVILSLIGIFLTFKGGSRGALIPFIFAFIIGLIHKGIKLSTLVPIAILALVLYNSEQYLVSVLGDSRSVSAISDGSIVRTSDRVTEVWMPVLNAILQSPIWGWGCFGDRLFTIGGQWSHNLFLEIMCDFGVFIGGFFLFFILKIFFKYCIKARNKVITVFFIMSIPQLLVSNSYLLSNYFWLFLGFTILWVKNRRQFSYNNNNLQIV